MSNKYLILYPSVEVRDKWLKVLVDYAQNTKLGIVSGLLPIIGNLSVLENMLVATYYHHKTSYKEGIKIATSDLKRFGMEQKLHNRSDQLDDFEKLVVKYFQVKYLQPEWIAFVAPRRMYVAEHEELFHKFLRCEDLKKTVIIEHEMNKEHFIDLPEYELKDFDTWLTQDLKI